MSNGIKLGILGTGKIVLENLPLISSLGFEQVTILTTPHSIDKTKKLCEEYGLDGYVTDYEEMLNLDLNAIYVALPNDLHYSYTKKALLAGKHVFLEKPATITSVELEELIALARKNHVILLEAMSLHYTPAFQSLKEAVHTIGDIKLVNFQFCQYSSRYDRFKQGDIAPAFDPKQYGGALMDVNVYNLHAILGLFGMPQKVNYLPNMERGIDTSGILHMEYDGFQALAIAAKDCQAPVHSMINGTKGCIHFDMPLNKIDAYTIYDNKGNGTFYDYREDAHRLTHEFLKFIQVVKEADFTFAEELAKVSLAAVRILETQRPY